MKVYNVPRKLVEGFQEPETDEKRKEFLDTMAWISFIDPDKPLINSRLFNDLPNLQLKFYDINFPVQDIKTKKWFFPPNEEHAKQIVDFILKVTGQRRNIIVNCTAGISRSGAVAEFCHNILGFEWPEIWKDHARPNPILAKKMRDYHLNKQGLYGKL